MGELMIRTQPLFFIFRSDSSVNSIDNENNES